MGRRVSSDSNNPPPTTMSNDLSRVPAGAISGVFDAGAAVLATRWRRAGRLHITER